MAEQRRFDHDGTHRLILAMFTEGSGLETLPLPAGVLSELSELDAATNERKLAERGRSDAISLGELVMGVPEAKIVNAAFTHPGPNGSRFSNRSRGAWYAGVELETSLTEAAFHASRKLQERRNQQLVEFVYQDYLADFHNLFHHLSQDEQLICLQPFPVPQCYGPGQTLAASLLYAPSNGIIYPSVRDVKHQDCIACFRPALVGNVRRGKKYILRAQAGRLFDVDRDVSSIDETERET